MAASHQRPRHRTRLTRKELKTPDEFLTLTGRFLGFAAQHLRTVSLVLGVVIACVVVMWGLLMYLRGIEQDAFASLSQIEAQIRATADSNSVSAELIERLQQIAQRYGAGEARGHAWLYLGHVYYRKGDFVTAVAAYQQALAQAKPTSLLRALAALGTAYAFEAAGDLKQAQEAYQRVIDARAPGFVLEAYLGKARVAEASHDLDTAIAAYAAVVEKFPAHAESLGLVEKLEALKAGKS
jgi:cytochrome c-type biogenesis protein CcmH/NrfG